MQENFCEYFSFGLRNLLFISYSAREHVMIPKHEHCSRNNFKRVLSIELEPKVEMMVTFLAHGILTNNLALI